MKNKKRASAPESGKLPRNAGECSMEDAFNEGFLSGPCSGRRYAPKAGKPKLGDRRTDILGSTAPKPSRK